MFLLIWRTILNLAIKAMIRNFNHGSWNRAFTKVFRKEFKIRAEVELDNAIWLIGKSIHGSRWVVSSTVKILKSNTLANPIFEERYFTSCKEKEMASLEYYSRYRKRRLLINIKTICSKKKHQNQQFHDKNTSPKKFFMKHENSQTIKMVCRYSLKTIYLYAILWLTCLRSSTKGMSSMVWYQYLYSVTWKFCTSNWHKLIN